MICFHFFPCHILVSEQNYSITNLKWKKNCKKRNEKKRNSSVHMQDKNNLICVSNPCKKRTIKDIFEWKKIRIKEIVKRKRNWITRARKSSPEFCFNFFFQNLVERTFTSARVIILAAKNESRIWIWNFFTSNYLTLIYISAS